MPGFWTLQFGLEVLDAGQRRRQLLRQLRGDRGGPFRDPDWHGRAAQGVLGDDVVLRSAQQQTDRRLIIGMSQKVIDSGHIHAQLPEETWIEVGGLQLDDYEAPQPKVV